jgi:hypothetical protein
MQLKNKNLILISMLLSCILFLGILGLSCTKSLLTGETIPIIKGYSLNQAATFNVYDASGNITDIEVHTIVSENYTYAQLNVQGAVLMQIDTISQVVSSNSISHELYMLTADKLAAIGYGDATMNGVTVYPAETRLKLPITFSDSWSYAGADSSTYIYNGVTSNAGATGTFNVTVGAALVNVNTPAGAFQCIPVTRFFATGMHKDIVYIASEGIVKIEHYILDSNNEYIIMNYKSLVSKSW